jgi:hypothetical protein
MGDQTDISRPYKRATKITALYLLKLYNARHEIGSQKIFFAKW